MTRHNWHMRMGDPTAIGWTITVAYFVAVFLCWKAAQKERKFDASEKSRKVVRLWFLLAATLAALGINKQLDLQTPFIYFARHFSVAVGWYEKKHMLQWSFVFVLVLAGVLFLGLYFLALIKQWKKYWPVLLGLLFLIIFVVIRAASFEHVNYLLEKWRRVGPIRMKYVVELGGILLIGIGALYEIKGQQK